MQPFVGEIRVRTEQTSNVKQNSTELVDFPTKILRLLRNECIQTSAVNQSKMTMACTVLPVPLPHFGITSDVSMIIISTSLQWREMNTLAVQYLCCARARETRQLRT